MLSDKTFGRKNLQNFETQNMNFSGPIALTIGRRLGISAVGVSVSF